MRISCRTVLVVATIALSVPMLAACEDDVDHDVSESVSVSPTTILTDEAKAANTFIAHFRAQYPKLAKGRDDQALVTDGDDTCNLFEDDKADRADTIGEISETFTANGIKPNDETVIDIATLAVKDLCPARAANVKTVL